MKSNMNRNIKININLTFFIFLICIVSILSPALELPLNAKQTGSGSETDIILSAMKDELDRSMKSLQIENTEKPYFLEYTIYDTRAWGTSAEFGALTVKSYEPYKWRYVKVGLRVGDYQLDNTAFLGDSFSFGGGVTRGLAIEDNYQALRRDLWLATDEAYKLSLEQLAEKKGYIENQVQKATIPDFSRAKTTTLKISRSPLTIDISYWKTTVKALSAIFREYPAIQDSSVTFVCMDGYRYYINSEGTNVCRPDPLVKLDIVATTRTEDGTRLAHHLPYYAPTAGGIPTVEILTAAVHKMAGELTALKKAPVMDNYIGPVLFTGQASAELFIQVLAPHFSGQRHDMAKSDYFKDRQFKNRLIRRINRRVLPRDISIVDDPTQTTYKGKPLLGSYPIDDQGVVPQPVSLVENGIFKEPLMSRRPRKDFLKSNGHARGSLFGKTVAQTSNLFITTRQGKSYKQLKQQLIKLCKEQGMEFGLIIKTVDSPHITDEDNLTYVDANDQVDRLTSPVIMMKVYTADGREELVRGIGLSEINSRYFKEIVATGSDYYVHNCILPANMGTYFMRTSGSVPGSVIAPPVLFEELEFTSTDGSRTKPPILDSPYVADVANTKGKNVK